MSLVPNRQLRLPTRAELRVVPSMSWVYFGLAAATVALRFAFPSNVGGPILLLVGAFASAGPAVMAAALACVAPRERLLQISAACFAIPLALLDMSVAFQGWQLYGIGADTSDWAMLGWQLSNWLNTLNSLSWILGIAAIAALAIYIGSVRSRTGWLIVVLGLVLTALKMAVAIGALAQLSDQLGSIIAQTPQLVISPAAPLATLAWAYLLAVAYDRRFVLFASGAAGQLLLALSALLIWTGPASLFNIGLGQDGDTAAVVVLIFVESVIGIGSFAALAVGTLRELPLAGRLAPTASAKQEPVAA